MVSFLQAELFLDDFLASFSEGPFEIPLSKVLELNFFRINISQYCSEKTDSQELQLTQTGPKMFRYTITDSRFGDLQIPHFCR